MKFGITQLNNGQKKQANRYFMQIFTVIDNICSNPTVGTTIDEIKKGHRKLI